MFLLFIIICVSSTIAFLFSALEASLLSLSNTDIAAISMRHTKTAETLKGFKENLQKPIAIILLLNTLAYIVGASFAGSVINARFGSQWVGPFSVVFSIFLIPWTEVLPKIIGVRYNRSIASRIAFPLTILIRIFSPIVALIHLITRPFEKTQKKDFSTDTLNEISLLARFARFQNIISAKQEEIVASGIQLSQHTVEEIMIKREDIKYLSTRMSLTDAFIEAHIHHHTRFPLIEGDNLDAVLGYVNFKDMVNVLRLNPQNPSLKSIARPILFVKPKDKLSEILTQLTKGYQHIAIVKDENGKTLGLITLEDIVESIVGSLSDEYDVLPTFCYPITETRFVVGGGIKLSECRKMLSSELPDLPITLNEWLLSQFKTRPKPETQWTYDHITFTVRKISRSKIHEVIVDLKSSG